MFDSFFRKHHVNVQHYLKKSNSMQVFEFLSVEKRHIIFYHDRTKTLRRIKLIKAYQLDVVYDLW